MVKIKPNTALDLNREIDLNAWLKQIAEKQSQIDLSLIKNTCMLSQVASQDYLTESGVSCLRQGLGMADILLDLEMDQETIAAAIIYDAVLYAELDIRDVTEQLGLPVGKLVKGVMHMSAINPVNIFQPNANNRQQIDNIRKMLLAMVDDVRVVLIKLAERLQVLRTSTHLEVSMQQFIAKEAMQIYAPLANRLGIGQIRWEMEDLAFRYLDPVAYKTIAKDLNARRVDRDRFVKQIVDILNHEIDKAKIHNATIFGRSKHIHSIHRKMLRKKVTLNQIYDATAVRVLVDSIEDCYKILGIVNHRWDQIPSEFDDYIARPKENGYRSLHTTVVGSEQKHFEVQIRTYEMHDAAELGIAAHWKYKEGDIRIKTSHERKIEWLRQLLAWQKEWTHAEGNPETIDTEVFDDRVYVFTPHGDIIDLPQGATPLDFAYHIHSEIGHRCRGAKVNGRIVQLTYPLKIGEQVEILTAKNAKPSRDWLNPRLGFLKSSRARVKAHHWFKLQDYNQHKEIGMSLMMQALEKLGITNIKHEQIANQFNFNKKEDLFAALGRGDIRTGQIIDALLPEQKTALVCTNKVTKPQRQSQNSVKIQGADYLLTYLAKCCHPIPGDDIIGYITHGKGVAVHRQGCVNILHNSKTQSNRLIQVDWDVENLIDYPVEIHVTGHDHVDLLRDVIVITANQNSRVVNLNTRHDSNKNQSYINLTVETKNVSALNQLLDKIHQLKYVIAVNRNQ